MIIHQVITSSYYNDLTLWDFEDIHDYFYVYFTYFKKEWLIVLLSVLLRFHCNLSFSLLILFVLPLSHHLSSLLIHKPTNKHCFLLYPGLLPAILMSTGKWQNQPSNKETCEEKQQRCNPGKQHTLRYSKMPAKLFLSPEISIWEILEELSFSKLSIIEHKIRKTK